MDLAAVESDRVLQQRLHSQSLARKAAEAKLARFRREADATHEQLDALRAELDERRALDKASEARQLVQLPAIKERSRSGRSRRRSSWCSSPLAVALPRRACLASVIYPRT